MIKILGRVYFGFAFFLGMTVTAFIESPPKQSSDWAGWVQAFGSILAIVGAYLLGERQAAAARVLAEEQAQRAKIQVDKARAVAMADRNSAIKALLDDVAEPCLNIRDRMSWVSTPNFQNFLHLPRGYMKDRAEVLEEIPLSELTSGELVTMLMQFKRALRRVSTMMDLIRDRQDGKDTFAEVEDDAIFANLEQDMTSAISCYRSCVSITGGDDLSEIRAEKKGLSSSH